MINRFLISAENLALRKKSEISVDCFVNHRRLKLMRTSHLKLSKIIIFLSFSILISSCYPATDEKNQNVLTTAWLSCESATGEATEHPFSGKAILVWNLHPEMDYQRDNRLVHTEQIGNLLLNDAPYFILGDYSETRYYPEYNTEDYFTYNLDEAGAFLCISVVYNDIETCTYGSNFYMIRTKADVNVKLVSWPNKQIISKTHVSTGEPKGCPPVLNTSQLGDHLVEVNNIDIWEWFVKYK